MSVVVAVDGSGAPVVDNAILLANCTTEIGIRNTLILAVSYRKISVVHAVSLLIIKKIIIISSEKKNGLLSSRSRSRSR